MGDEETEGALKENFNRHNKIGGFAESALQLPRGQIVCAPLSAPCARNLQSSGFCRGGLGLEICLFH